MTLDTKALREEIKLRGSWGYAAESLAMLDEIDSLRAQLVEAKKWEQRCDTVGAAHKALEESAAKVRAAALADVVNLIKGDFGCDRESKHVVDVEINNELDALVPAIRALAPVPSGHVVVKVETLEKVASAYAKSEPGECSCDEETECHACLEYRSALVNLRYACAALTKERE